MIQKTKQKIEVNAQLKTQLADMFNVTTQFVSFSLLFRRNSDRAKRIRKAALENGGRLVQIIDVTDEQKKTIKVLDSKGNVKQIIN